MTESVERLVRKFKETRSIAIACKVCDLLYKELQEGEKNDKED